MADAEMSEKVPVTGCFLKQDPKCPLVANEEVFLDNNSFSISQ